MNCEPLPMRFAQYRDRHRGEPLLVCGCGESLNLLQHPERFVTIGVNDVGRRFTPDYLVVVNERRQFDANRYSYVERTQAKAVFTQLEQLALPHPRVVRFRLGRRGGTDRLDGQSLHYSNNSPYVGVNLARHFGARRIGLLGVDFTDHHFFGQTGRHPLADQLRQIDREYAALAAACRAEGIELVNLSPSSRLQSLPRESLEEWGGTCCPGARRRIFFVHYRFLSCGTVFETGLREAATELGIAHEHAYWDEAELPHRIKGFAPDLLFVVHGRRYVQRWGRRFAKWRSAVWLLDEPYEVDDTSTWSGQFDTVFVTDPSSLGRHRNAHELPAAYAPMLHHGLPEAERRRHVGFVGGANAAREGMLGALARRNLLDYVVGGPWSDSRLKTLCLAPNVTAERTADLYRETSIVLNIFRDRHHYNNAGLPGLAMNPRVVEALACGSLVLSEPRPRLADAVPELPTFRTEAEAAALIEFFLSDPAERLRVQRACAARLAGATYHERLRTAMDVALKAACSAPRVPPDSLVAPVRPTKVAPQELVAAEMPADAVGDHRARPFDELWDDIGGVVRQHRAELVIDPGPQRGPGVERGLASRLPYEAVGLAFEARLGPGAVLVAKLHQLDRVDQSTNSYHLLMEEHRAYLARHHHVFRNLEPPGSAWVRWRLACESGLLSVWRNGSLLHRARDRELAGGYAFVGAQGGEVHVRKLKLVLLERSGFNSADRDDGVQTLLPVRTSTPRVSIVTTVYDRTECLRQCMASVRRLSFRDYEHLIVADHPPPEVIEKIRGIVARVDDPRVGLYNLSRRHNNWGIAPAAAGLRRSRGEFISFLSDDNGYLPDHFNPLIRMLDGDPRLGFVYSSCQYDGRLVLAHPKPTPGGIDLGQMFFRRELFELHFDDDLPFDMMAWDWHLVDALTHRGVRWRHVNRPTFLFRLAKYPRLMPIERETAS